jgi:replicative DNA helicase
VGKSTLAANIVRNVLHANGSVFLATMEMSTDDVMTQLCAAHTGCPYEKIQDAHLGDEEVQAATGIFSQALINWRLSIDDRGTQTVASIRRGVKRHIRLAWPFPAGGRLRTAGQSQGRKRDRAYWRD